MRRRGGGEGKVNLREEVKAKESELEKKRKEPLITNLRPPPHHQTPLG
jgi:hypothetical protein